MLLSNLHKCMSTLSVNLIKQRSFQLNHLVKSSNNLVLSRYLSTKLDDKPNAVAGQKIYHGTLASQIRLVKIFSLGTSVGGIVAQPMLYQKGIELGGTPMVIFMCSFVGFFTFVTPFLLHWITKSYVIEMNYDFQSDSYTATTYTLFLRKKTTNFKVSDVTVPDVPGMFMSFLIGKQKFFIDPSLFPDPSHYMKIMGYDKPLDFKLNLTEKDGKVYSKDDEHSKKPSE